MGSVSNGSPQLAHYPALKANNKDRFRLMGSQSDGGLRERFRPGVERLGSRYSTASLARFLIPSSFIVFPFHAVSSLFFSSLEAAAEKQAAAEQRPEWQPTEGGRARVSARSLTNTLYRLARHRASARATEGAAILAAYIRSRREWNTTPERHRRI